MSEQVTAESLKGLAFLAAAGEPELQELAKLSTLVEYPAGGAIFREGQKEDRIQIVLSGSAAIEVHSAGYRPRRIMTLGAGELLGWSPVLGHGIMTASAKALTKTKAVAIDAEAIRRWCDKDPKFGYAFMKRLAGAIAQRLNATRLQLLDVYKHVGTEPGAEGGAR